MKLLLCVSSSASSTSLSLFSPYSRKVIKPSSFFHAIIMIFYGPCSVFVDRGMTYSHICTRCTQQETSNFLMDGCKTLTFFMRTAKIIFILVSCLRHLRCHESKKSSSSASWVHFHSLSNWIGQPGLFCTARQGDDDDDHHHHYNWLTPVYVSFCYHRQRRR